MRGPLHKPAERAAGPGHPSSTGLPQPGPRTPSCPRPGPEYGPSATARARGRADAEAEPGLSAASCAERICGVVGVAASSGKRVALLRDNFHLVQMTTDCDIFPKPLKIVPLFHWDRSVLLLLAPFLSLSAVTQCSPLSSGLQ